MGEFQQRMCAHGPRALAACALTALASVAVAACGETMLVTEPEYDKTLDLPGVVEGGESAGESADFGPPELEEQPEGDRPQVTSHYVYVMDPPGARVVRIGYADAQGQLDESPEMRVIPAGANPRAAAAVPGADALVLLTDYTGAEATAQAEAVTIDSTPTQDIVRRAALTAPYTHLAVAPGGGHAVAYFNQNPGLASGAAPEIVVPQVAVIDLAGVRGGVEGAVREYAVGPQVTNVFFAQDGGRAYAVSRSEVYVITLTGAGPEGGLPFIPLLESTYTRVPDREALAAPDGRFIFVRGLASNIVKVLDTQKLTASDWVLPGPPSDMDIAPEGDALLVVLRTQHNVITVDIKDGVPALDEMRLHNLGDHAVGQAEISPRGGEALLFTTAENREELVRLDLTAGSYSRVALTKAVASVRFAPDGGYAFVRLRPVADSKEADTYEAGIDKLDGYALYGLDSGALPERVLTQKAGEAVFTADGGYLAILTQELGAPAIETVELRGPSFAGRVSLPSRPLFLGALPGSARVYAAVEHPYGRLVFVDLAANEVTALTGFVLNAEIE